MDIGSQARVVSQVIPDVVWVVVDDDVVAVPQPVRASIVIIWRCLKEESADIKAVAIAAMQPPDVMGADGSGEVSVLPGMIEMIVRIAPSGFVSHPVIILSMNVWRRRMPGPVLIGSPLLGMLGLVLRWFRCWGVHRSRAVLRDVPAPDALLVYGMLLRCLMWLTVLLSAVLLCQRCPGKNHCDHYEQDA